MQRAGVVVTEHSLLQVDVVFTALRIITTSILKMGAARAYTEALSADNIPYRKFCAKQPLLLTDPWGGRMMLYDGMRRTLMSMGLFSEAFWYVLARDETPKRFGMPIALEVLHPAFMEVRADDTGAPVYLYGSAMDRKQLPAEDVVHIPFMAMPQARRGLATTQYLGVAGALAMAAYEFGSTWFSQGAAPSFILSTEQKLGQEEVQRIAQRFAIEHSGLQMAHMPLVLDSGLKADKVMTSPDEAQYLQPLALDTDLLTTDGWKTVGTVEPGDTVFAENGERTEVLGVSPVYLNTPCFELTFADGSQIVANEDHRWHVFDVYSHQRGCGTDPGYKGEWKTLSTADIAANWRWYAGRNRYRVACDGVLDTDHVDLPIDPYVLGYWLGDGSSADSSFTVGLDDQQHLEAELVGAGHAITSRHDLTGGWGVSRRIRVGGEGSMSPALRELGIFGVGNKRIPDTYMLGSVTQRKALLAGLLDSDGSAFPYVRFTTTLPGLADDVLTLARSLGQRAYMVMRDLPPRAGVKTSKPQWVVQWTATFDPFRMARKSKRANVWGPPGARMRRGDKDLRRMSIVGVRPVTSVATRCIKVAHPSHVFLVGRTFVPTGNTLEYQRNVIASWFGIPETVLPNALQRQTPPPPHTAQEETMRMLLYTLSGYIVPIEQALSALLPAGMFATFMEDGLSRPDSQFLAQEIMALRQTQVMTPNEIRARKLHLGPLPDPMADQAIAPLASNTAPSQTVSPPAGDV